MDICFYLKFRHYRTINKLYNDFVSGFEDLQGYIKELQRICLMGTPEQIRKVEKSMRRFLMELQTWGEYYVACKGKDHEEVQKMLEEIKTINGGLP